MLSVVETLLDSLDSVKKKNLEGQLGFFDTPGAAAVDSGPDLPPVDEFPANDLMTMEKEVTGLYLTGHPMASYAKLADKLRCARIGEILEEHEETGRYRDGSRVTLLCIVSSVRLKATKNNSTMAFVQVEDMYGTIESLVFPQTLTQYAHLLKENNVVLLHGRVSAREEEDAEIICEQVSLPTDASGKQRASSPETRKPKRSGLFLQVPGLKSREYERANLLLSIFEGNTPVYFFCKDTRKLLMAPAKLWVDFNEALFGELKNQLGEENVVMRE